MSGDEDIACLGLCMDDPDSGVCLGCGRRPRVAWDGSAGENGDGLRGEREATRNMQEG